MRDTWPRNFPVRPDDGRLRQNRLVGKTAQRAPTRSEAVLAFHIFADDVLPDEDSNVLLDLYILKARDILDRLKEPQRLMSLEELKLTFDMTEDN